MKVLFVAVLILSGVAQGAPLPPARDAFLKTADQLQTILGAQAEALNAVDTGQVANLDGKKPWRLAGMVAGLELKASGLFNLAKIEGTENIQVQWYKDESGGPKAPGAQILNPSTVVLKDGGAGFTLGNVTNQAEPAVQEAIASGKINSQSVSRFRNNVKRAAQSFLRVSGVLARVPPVPGWKPDAFFLEVSFNGNGDISPTVSLGGGVTLRFDWERDGDIASKGSDEKNRAGSPLDAKLESFVVGLGQDLNDSTKKAFLPGTGLELDEVKISLGISAEGDVGVAQGSAGVTGTLAFHRNNKASVTFSDLTMAKAEVPMALFQPIERIEEEKLKGLHLSKNFLPKFNVIQIKRDPFRRGLDHAIKFSQSIARLAVKSSKGKWKVVEVSSEFDLGISGELGLANIKGTKGIEFIFTVPQWHTL